MEMSMTARRMFKRQPKTKTLLIELAMIRNCYASTMSRTRDFATSAQMARRRRRRKEPMITETTKRSRRDQVARSAAPRKRSRSSGSVRRIQPSFSLRCRLQPSRMIRQCVPRHPPLPVSLS